MSDMEKSIIKKWIIKNIDDRVVPMDEGNGDGLVYNMIMLLELGHGEEFRNSMYNYKRHQHEKLVEWGLLEKEYLDDWDYGNEEV